MTDNDYIAEYVRERYPKLLGLDFAFWKMSRVAKEVVTDAVNAFKKIDSHDICWITGKYTDQDCELCPYKMECSGYEGDDDDEDNGEE